MGEGLEPVRARGYWEQVWIRFKRDKIAITGGIYIIFVLLAGFVGAPVAQHFLGHDPDTPFAGGVDANTFLPVGPWTHVSLASIGEHGSTLFLLGGDSQLGRDEFLRLLYGTQVSMEVAIGATVLSMVIGVLMGSLAGYFGGWIDTIISRLTDITMAFPLLLFIIALASTVGPRLDGITLGGIFEKGVITLVLILGFFGVYYPARIVRASVLSIREKEVVAAARMVGARALQIIGSDMLSTLLVPIMALASVTVADSILVLVDVSLISVAPG